MTYTTNHRQEPDPLNRLTTAAVFAAPVLTAASSLAYAMEEGMNRGEIGGVLQFYAWTVVAIAFVGLTARLRDHFPRTAATLLATGLIAAASGASYGIDAIWAVTTDQPQLVDQELAAGLAAMGPAALLLPATLIGLGIAYARAGLAPAYAGYLLALAGLTFPAGRATNLLPIALATDALLLVALMAIGRSLMQPAADPVATPRDKAVSEWYHVPHGAHTSHR